MGDVGGEVAATEQAAALEPEDPAAWSATRTRSPAPTASPTRWPPSARSRSGPTPRSPSCSSACATPSRASSPRRRLEPATGADVLVSALESPASRPSSASPACTTSRRGRRCATSPIRLIGVRHEQAAVYAADGYARATGALGVALVTTGPGRGQHAGSDGGGVGVALAHPRHRDRRAHGLRREGVHRGMLHEVPDQAGLFRAGDQGGARVERAEDVGPVVARALTQATTPPARPVYVEVPTDLLAAQATGTGQSFLSASRIPVRQGRT